MSNSIPGWYSDPTVSGQQRYWDGTQWTDHVAPLPQSLPPIPPPGYAPAPPPYAGYQAPGYAAPGYGTPQTGTAYAHWGRRVGASLIDFLLILPFVIGGIVVLAANTTTTTQDYGYGYTATTDSTNLTGSALIVFLIIVASGIAVSGWNRWFRQGKTGYSIGKQALGIKLIRERTGQPLGGGLAFGREILHAADNAVVYIGYLWPLWDPKRQTFADKIVSSIVVVAPKPKD